MNRFKQKKCLPAAATERMPAAQKSGNECGISKQKMAQVLRPSTRSNIQYNLSLDNLISSTMRDEDAADELVYCYIVDTLILDGEQLVQKGSGPNIEGGWISLCTCKHFMRSFKEFDPDAYGGKRWIAGFTGRNLCGDKRNRLFYLMRASHAFSSHSDLWNSTLLGKISLQQKSAANNPFGDIYEPKKIFTDKHSASSYLPPVENHCHADNNYWHKDIEYRNRWGNRSSLLVGDCAQSYVWTAPSIRFEMLLARALESKTMGEFVEHLQEVVA